MYDDLLGKRKEKEVKPEIDIGKCGQCLFTKESKIHRRSTDIYCTKIKKYVHKQAQSCLKFKRKQEVHFGIS
jgi:hypothetical protein